MDIVSKVFDKPKIDSEVESIMDSIKEGLKIPFVPNLFAIWADAPEALKGIFPVMKHILFNGKLSRPLKEMIIIAISSKKECEYCTVAHQAFACMLGVSMEDIQSLKADTTTINEPKIKAVISYAVKLAEDPKSGTTEDIAQLEALGYSKAEVLEIIAMSGMAVFYNHLADATQINIDEAFLQK